MSTEITAAKEAVEKALHDLRETNAKALAEKVDRADLKEQMERINADINARHDALNELIKQAQEAADAANAERQRGELGNADKRAELGRFAAEWYAGKDGRPSAEMNADKIAAYAEYSKAFRAFLKYGPDSQAMQQPEIRAAMSVGSDPDGGYWVPAEMSSDVKRRIFETSPIRQIASVLSITTDSIKFPVETGDAVSGGWVGETATRSETNTPTVGEQEIFVREQYAQPKVTQKLLDMATVDVEAWLNGKIADKMSRVENTAFVSGTGVSQPRGFLDYKSAATTTDDASRAWGVLQYVASGAAGGFPKLSGTVADDPNALITTISKLKPAYRAGAVWLMNRATEAAVRKLVDADGRHLVGFGDVRDSVTGFSLLGFPIVTAEDMPDIAADSFSIAFGNFSVGYQIVDGRGLRILRDPYTEKPYVKFYTTKWTGGDVVNYDALKLIKFAV